MNIILNNTFTILLNYSKLNLILGTSTICPQYVKDHFVRTEISDSMTEVYTVEERQHAENSSLPCLFSNEDEQNKEKKKEQQKKKVRQKMIAFNSTSKLVSKEGDKQISDIKVGKQNQKQILSNKISSILKVPLNNYTLTVKSLRSLRFFFPSKTPI